ncbi:hypothetical protein [Pseudoalteromonas byunsanensis]|uniref:Uncharacterized protein n=1 Tax=Pseudoalteromonas byunsanensis TaxID=327939 RepID=A0A1S1NFU2_9GAMM|nr:hypothetical protein [Pseudoalteromonas byunsanensis]OHU97323.1 hypothetical protein BIW53_03100 [Pseudoalteromonas byunsanensis]
MLPPINQQKTNFGRITKTTKVKSDLETQKTSASALSSNDKKPVKGKIRQLVFNTLKQKYGDKLASEPEFIKMVDTICARLEPSITDSERLQEELEKLLKQKL